jgi:hypothetical protein
MKYRSRACSVRSAGGRGYQGVDFTSSPQKAPAEYRKKKVKHKSRIEHADAQDEDNFYHQLNRMANDYITAPQESVQGITTIEENRPPSAAMIEAGMSRDATRQQIRLDVGEKFRSDALELEVWWAAQLQQVAENPENQSDTKHPIPTAHDKYQELFDEIIQRDKQYGTLLTRVKTHYDDTISALYSMMESDSDKGLMARLKLELIQTQQRASLAEKELTALKTEHSKVVAEQGDAAQLQMRAAQHQVEDALRFLDEHEADPVLDVKHLAVGQKDKTLILQMQKQNHMLVSRARQLVKDLQCSLSRERHARATLRAAGIETIPDEILAQEVQQLAQNREQTEVPTHLSVHVTQKGHMRPAAVPSLALPPTG